MDVDTHSRKEHVQLMTDKNESTCLTVPSKRPVQLVAELTLRIQIENATIDDAILEIQLSLFNSCERIILFNSTTKDNCASVKKVQGMIGEIIPTLSPGNFCYYKLPVVCGSSFF